MRAFFHGWRRKTGCVTLVIACVMMAVWVRSRIQVDCICLESRRADFRFVSGGGRFRLVQGSPGMRQLSIKPSTASRSVLITTKPQSSISKNTMRLEWTVWQAPAVNINPESLGAVEATTMYSYWFLITPMTLLSAYLILVKPRQKA